MKSGPTAVASSFHETPRETSAKSKRNNATIIAFENQLAEEKLTASDALKMITELDAVECAKVVRAILGDLVPNIISSWAGEQIDFLTCFAHAFAIMKIVASGARAG